VCLEPLSGNDCRCSTDDCAVPAAVVWSDAGNMASSLRRIGGYRGRILREGCANHGFVFYGVGNDRSLRTVRVGELVYGGRIWCAPHHFRSRDRKEVWWLDPIRQRSIQGLRTPVLGPRKAEPRIWTD